MIAFSLQQYIADNTVPVFVQGSRILFILVRHDFRLQHCGFFGIRTNIVKPVPAVHILLDGLTVKKHYRYISSRCRINDPGGGCAVHRIDTERITAQRYKAFHLLILDVLVSLGILNVQCHLDARLLFIFLGPLFQLRPDITDKGIICPVQAYSDADRMLLLRGCSRTAAGKQYAGQGHAGRRNYLPVTFFLIPVFFHYEAPPTQWDKAFSRIPGCAGLLSGYNSSPAPLPLPFSDWTKSPRHAGRLSIRY